MGKYLSVREFKKWLKLDLTQLLSLRHPRIEEKYKKRDKSKDPINLHDKGLILLPNDFPYRWEKGIKHNILWYHGEWVDLEKNYKEWIRLFIRDYELLWINPSHLRSIKSLPHCHVLVKSFSIFSRDSKKDY